LLKAYTAIAIAVAVLAFLLTAVLTGISGNQTGQQAMSDLGYYDGLESRIQDMPNDAAAVQQYEADVVPEVRDYHDILAASVKEIDGAFLLTIELAGNPNLNEKYETNYVWHIITSDHVYTVFMPNFADDSNFPKKGWYFAVYDETLQRYVVPITKISDMPQNSVQFPVESTYIGNPSSFSYWVSVLVRVDSENLDEPPEYLMDYAP
jgi:hypothetical protein